MTCINCGFNLEDGLTVCPHCQENPRVKVLSQQEKEAFQGLTIEQGQPNQNHDHYHETNGRVYVRHINLNSNKGGFFLKLLLGLGLLLLVVIALPLAVFLSVFIGMIWFLNRPASR